LVGAHYPTRVVGEDAKAPETPGWECHNGRENPICEGLSAMGKMIELIAADGFQLSAYRAEPEGDPRGGVVVAQEIFGVNSHIKSVCDGFAKDGYVVIAPALFDRYERNVDIGYTADDIARGRALKVKATTDAALQDIGAARDALSDTG
jgi:carboxymethylenebutenolidase